MLRAATSPSRPRPVEAIADLRRRFRQLRYLLLHYAAHRRYLNEIERYVNRGMMHGGVFERYKYLGDYLARSLSRRTRRLMILSHYRFVGSLVTDAAFRALSGDGILLWRHKHDPNLGTILLTNGSFAPMEGEWQLQFLVDGAVICTLSFLFVSLPKFAEDGKVVCLIGGLQGGHDCRSAIRLAAKANHEIAPTTMLILAAKAIAQTLGVNAVFGASSQQQIVGLYAADRMKADYDVLWTSEGAARRVEGFYALTHDLIERPLTDIPRAHRRRTKLKRYQKKQILAGIMAETKTMLLGNRPASR